MNVYLESNFVLELALLQEQSESCERILSLGEAGRVQLAVPALAEPYETLVRRHRRRNRTKNALDWELGQIARSAAYKDRLGAGVTALLPLTRKSGAWKRYASGSAADIIPLEASVLAAATQYQSKHDFSPQDALVYSAVLAHLEEDYVRPSCFLNKDGDFDDREVLEELGGYNCMLFSRFDAGYRYILDNLD